MSSIEIRKIGITKLDTDAVCLKWIDYEIIREQLEEADELCHGNWIEIQHMRDYIDQLQALLRENGIEVPIEYF